METKPRLGYWNIRGYAQPIRLLLCYAGVDFEDTRYNYLPVADGSFDRSEWLNVKPTLGLDFPNVKLNYILTTYANVNNIENLDPLLH